MVVLPLLVGLSQVNFLLFHVMAEGFAFVVGVLLFFVAAITWRWSRDGFLYTLGAGYFWIACADFLHTIAYKGMGVFPGDSANPATQYWILTRFAEALLLLLAPAMLGRSVRPWRTFLIFGALFTVGVVAVQSGSLPAAYIDGQGLTPLKVALEFVVIALLGLALWRYHARRADLGTALYRTLALSVALTAVAELFFTFYVSVYGLSNLAGHLLKFLSFWLIFLTAEHMLLTNPMRSMKKDESALNGLSDPVMLVGPDGQVRHANAAARRTFGLSSLQGDLCDLGPLRGQEPASCPVCQAVAAGEQAEGLEVCDAAENRWYSVDVTPLEETDTLVVQMHDITALKTLEQRVQEEKLRADLALDNSGLGTWDWSLTEDHVTFSGRVMAMLGYDPADWAPKPASWRDRVHPDDLAWVEAEMQAHLEGQSPVYDTVHRLRRQDGSYAWVRDIGRVVEWDEAGRPARVIGTHADVTVTKELELSLQRSNLDLEQFAYAVSHDLQEPLRMISGFLGVLRRRYQDDLPGEAREFVGRAVDGADRMTLMIRDLLAVSRVKSMGGDMVLFDLGEAVEAATENLSASLVESGAAIRVEGALPAVRADKSQVIRLLQNLMGNAVKYAAPDRLPEVTVCARVQAGMVEVRVADNGVGIPEKDRDHVFQPFQRLHGRDVPGSGIGLTLCRRIIDRHGGTIRIAGEETEGTTVVFTLPLADQEVAPPPKAPAETA